MYSIISYSSPYRHRTDQNYWKGLNVDGWSDEIEGMRKMISQFAAIPKEEVKGKGKEA